MAKVEHGVGRCRKVDGEGGRTVDDGGHGGREGGWCLAMRASGVRVTHINLSDCDRIALSIGLRAFASSPGSSSRSLRSLNSTLAISRLSRIVSTALSYTSRTRGATSSAAAALATPRRSSVK